MDTLTALFGSEARVKLIRLFLFNPEEAFEPRELARRTMCSPAAVRSEMRSLAKSGIVRARGKSGFSLDQRFPYMDALKSLLIVSSVSADGSLTRRFAKAGKLKVLVAAGVFIQNWDSRVDLLIVGDRLSQARVETAVRGIEAEIGKEISYSVFETQDFEYRLGMHDRLIRDILDYPHVTLLDRLGVAGE